MALVLNDRVKETTTTTGTGTVNLAGAETGFETFVAGIGNTNTTYYAIVHQSAAEFEVGLGTVSDSSPDTLSRTTIISSSNSDSAVNFSAGTKDVFCTLPASKAVFEDSSNNVAIPSGGLSVGSSSLDPLGLVFTGTALTLNEDSGTAFFQIDSGNGSRIDFGVSGSRNTTIYADANGAELSRTTNHPIAFKTNNTERMRILGSGNVGIGTTSPAAVLDVKSSGTTSTAFRVLKSDAGQNLHAATEISGHGRYSIYDSSENEDIRLDTNGNSYFNGGNVGIGDSSPDSLLHVNSGSTNVAAKFESTDSIAAIQFTDSGGSAEIGCSGTSNTFYPNGALKMSLDSSGNLVASGNITAYGSPSDIKLKENIEVIDNALDKVKQLKGITYDLKSDGNRLTGLIAQDLEKVLPEAVYTAKDLEDEEHLAIRYGNTVGLLVEAIKEQQEQIETLTARVKELEGK